jgi:putative redox protein
MDVISILRKMREPVSWFEMRVSADLAEEHPKRYTRYLITYSFLASDNLKRENVIKAATLSQDKYCGVSASLSPGAPIEWAIEFV